MKLGGRESLGVDDVVHDVRVVEALKGLDKSLIEFEVTMNMLEI